MRAEDLSLGLVMPPAFLETIARRVFEIIEAEGRLAPPAPVSEYLSPDEAAAFLRSNRQRIYDLVSARRLRKFKDGSRLLIARADLERYVAGRAPTLEGANRTAAPNGSTYPRRALAVQPP